MSTITTQLFLAKAWREFRSPYYDAGSGRVYYSLYLVDKTKLPDGITLDMILKNEENIKEVLNYFDKHKLFLVPIDKTPPAVVLPVSQKDKDKSCEIAEATEKSGTSVETGLTLSSVNGRRYDIGPRPEDPIKLLYSIDAFEITGFGKNKTKTQIVDIDKVKKLFDEEEANKNKPQSADQKAYAAANKWLGGEKVKCKNTADCVAAKVKGAKCINGKCLKDFSISIDFKMDVYDSPKLCRKKCLGASPETASKSKKRQCAKKCDPFKKFKKFVKDLKKIGNIQNLDDLNAFLGATVESSAQLRSKYLAGPLNAKPGDLKTQLDMAIMGPMTDFFTKASKDLPTRADVSNEALQATEFIADYFLIQGIPAIGDIDQAIKNFKNPLHLDAVGAKSDWERWVEKSKNTLEPIIKWINRLGLIGLLECVVALAIEKMAAQGYVALAAMLTVQLDKLARNFLAFSVEYAKYRKIWEELRKRQGKTIDWGKIIKESLYTALEEGAVQMVKLCLRYCLSKLGSDNPENDFNFGGLAPNQVYDDRNLPLKGLPSHIAGGKPPTPDEATNVLDFVDAVFKNMSPTQICRLLEGMADYELVQFCEFLLRKEQYKDKAQKFFLDEVGNISPQKIADFFRQIGINAGTYICDELNKKSNEEIEMVDFCGIKVAAPIRNNLGDKMDDEALEGLIKNLKQEDDAAADAIADLLSGDFPQNIVPEFDNLVVLEPSYHASQSTLRDYKTLFDSDWKGAVHSPLDNIFKPSAGSQAKNVVDKLDDKPPKMQFPKILGNILGNMPGVTTGSLRLDVPIFDEQALKTLTTPNKTEAAQGAFTLINTADFKLNVNTKGNFTVGANISAIYNNIPKTGKASKGSNAEKSPLTIIGENIPFPASEKNTPPALRTLIESPSVTVADLYADIVFGITQEKVQKVSDEIKAAWLSKEPEFYRVERLKRIHDSLCKATKDETEANKHYADDSLAIKVESLRVLVYSLIIEKYPYLYWTAVVNPEGFLGTDIKIGMIPSMVQAFKDLVAQYGVTIPVKNLMCEMDLTVEDLVQDELKFIKSVVPSHVTSLPSYQSILEANLTVDYSKNVPFLYRRPKGAWGAWMETFAGASGAAGKGYVGVKNLTMIGKLGTDKSAESFLDQMISKALINATQGKDGHAEEGVQIVKSANKNKAWTQLNIDQLAAKINIFFSATLGTWSFTGMDEFRVIFPLIINTFLFMEIYKNKNLVASGKLKVEPSKKETEKLVETIFFNSDSFTYDDGTVSQYWDGRLKYYTKEQDVVVKEISMVGMPLGKMTTAMKQMPAMAVAVFFKQSANPQESYVSGYAASELMLMMGSGTFKDSAGYTYSTKVKKFFGEANLPTIQNPIMDAFNSQLMEAVAAYYLNAYALQASSSTKIFKKLQPTILAAFSGGMSLAATEEELTLAFKAFNMAMNVEEQDFNLWLMILLLIPKIIIGAIKALLMTALYMSAPMMYFLIMLMTALGLGPEEFIDWLQEQIDKAILKKLDPDSQEAKDLQHKISARAAKDKGNLLPLDCKK